MTSVWWSQEYNRGACHTNESENRHILKNSNNLCPFFFTERFVLMLKLVFDSYICSIFMLKLNITYIETDLNALSHSTAIIFQVNA